MDIGSILTALAPALVVLVAGYLVHRHIVSKPRMQSVYEYAKLAVLAAEEFHGRGGPGSAKFDYAVQTVLDRFGITAEEAEAFVLASVKQLRGAGYLKSDKPEPPPVI